MAIDDLITRIESDAAAEVAAIAARADEAAASALARAQATAAAEREAVLEQARRAAREQRDTVLAGARLKARDALLTGKRRQAEQVLERAQHDLESLPDDEYLALIAAAVRTRAVTGDLLAIAPADAQRLAGLAKRLKDDGVAVGVSPEPAAQERGVLLTGDRVRLEVSPASLVADHRERLLLVASRVLFGERDERQ